MNLTAGGRQRHHRSGMIVVLGNVLPLSTATTTIKLRTASGTHGSASGKNPKERWLTVGSQYDDEYPAHVPEQRRSRRVPWLQMRGDWLAAAGFDIQGPVRVRVMRGCLVLTVEES